MTPEYPSPTPQAQTPPTQEPPKQEEDFKTIVRELQQLIDSVIDSASGASDEVQFRKDLYSALWVVRKDLPGKYQYLFDGIAHDAVEKKVQLRTKSDVGASLSSVKTKLERQVKEAKKMLAASPTQVNGKDPHPGTKK
jgi:hypothetical protein